MWGVREEGRISWLSDPKVHLYLLLEFSNCRYELLTWAGVEGG